MALCSCFYNFLFREFQYIYIQIATFHKIVLPPLHQGLHWNSFLKDLKGCFKKKIYKGMLLKISYFD